MVCACSEHVNMYSIRLELQLVGSLASSLPRSLDPPPRTSACRRPCVVGAASRVVASSTILVSHRTNLLQVLYKYIGISGIIYEHVDSCTLIRLLSWLLGGSYQTVVVGGGVWLVHPFIRVHHLSSVRPSSPRTWTNCQLWSVAAVDRRVP